MLRLRSFQIRQLIQFKLGFYSISESLNPLTMVSVEETEALDKSKLFFLIWKKKEE